MKKCIVIGAGAFNGLRPEFMADYIIAADGGYGQLTVDNGQSAVDLLVGDFDSIGDCEIPSGVEFVRFPAEKDASDVELAVREAVCRGFDCIYIYGALGKRLDHTLGSIAVLVSLSRKGLTGWLIGENETVTAVTDGKIALGGRESGFVSVFPAGEKAGGVSLNGFKYTLNDEVLTCDSTRGLSNEFIGEKAEIEVKDGTLIVVIPD